MKLFAIITGLITLLLGALILALFLYPPYSQAVSETIVIGEISISQPGNTDADFVQLYNRSANPFNLKGWRLIKRSTGSTSDTTLKSWTDDTLVAPSSAHIWAHNSYADIIMAHSQSNYILAKDNCIALRQGAEDEGTILDAVGWGTCSQLAETAPIGNPDAGTTLKRLNMLDSDNNLADFASGNTTTGSTTSGSGASSVSSGGSSTPKAKIAFNEVCSNPQTGSEWLELIHDSQEKLDLTDYYIEDKSGDKAKLKGLYSTFVLIEKPSISLNNDEEVLKLFSPSGQLLDSVAYSGEQAPAKGQSLAKNEAGSWVLTDQLTPGAGNIISLSVDEEEDESTSDGKAGAKTIIINEILPNPVGEDASAKRGEFIELLNTSDQAVDISDYWLVVDGAQSYQLAGILAASSALAIEQTSSSLRINNGGGEIKLLNGALKTLDRVKYPRADEGLAWAFTDSKAPLLKTWVWTLLPSPNASNTILTLNQAPVAVLACPETGRWFDGSDSYDPDGQDIRAEWQLNDQIFTGFSLELPPDSQGRLILTVSDGLLTSETDCRLSKQVSPAAAKETAKKTPSSTKKVAATTKSAKTTASSKSSTASKTAVQNQRLQVQGRVLSLPGQVASQYFYLLDEQGQSWQIYQHSKKFPSLELNQRLQVSGRLSDSQDRRLLIDQAADIQVLAAGSAIVADEYRIGDLQAELAGQLVQVQGHITGKKGQLVYVDDGYGEVTLVLSADYKSTSLSKGQELQAIGILRDSASGLRLQLRQISDLTLLNAASASLSSSSQALELTATPQSNRYWLIATAVLLLAAASLLLFKKDKNKIPKS